MPSTRISPCLWFDDQAQEAAAFYVGIFPNARLLATTHYGEAGQEIHGRPPGSVMTVEFELDGTRFTALNGGPQAFAFNMAVSFEVHCATQEEVDHYWARLGEGGDPQAQQCGWLTDKYGVSWQVVPEGMTELLTGDPQRAERVMSALLQMKKLDIAALERAAAG
ncbi:VOC family protein [Ectothiorhodospiraceae bacterium 2226]|nr:VOC family protein [Ectothiorhodospiraceae bacterium 2226]